MAPRSVGRQLTVVLGVAVEQRAAGIVTRRQLGRGWLQRSLNVFAPDPTCCQSLARSGDRDVVITR